MNRDSDKASRDDEFLIHFEERIKNFIQSDDRTLQLEPMNSYLRRMLHEVAKDYGLGSDSVGEEPNRYLVLKKTEETKIPEGKREKRLPVWHYGDREFLVNPMEPVDVFLGADGSVGVYDPDHQGYVIDRKKVSKAFKIKKNKIVEFIDEMW